MDLFFCLKNIIDINACRHLDMGVSKNNDTPKSSNLIGFSIINHPFRGTPIFGNTHMCIYVIEDRTNESRTSRVEYSELCSCLDSLPGKPRKALFLRQQLLVLGVKLPKKIGHLAFQVVLFVFLKSSIRC